MRPKLTVTPCAPRSDSQSFLCLAEFDGKTFSRTVSVSDAQRAVAPDRYRDQLNYELLKAIKQIERQSGWSLLKDGATIDIPTPYRIAILDDLWPDAAEV